MTSKYQLHKVEHVGLKPIQSIGTYTSLDAECIVGGSSDRILRFLDVDDLEEIAKTTVNKKSVNCVAISEMTIDGDDPIIVTGGKDSFIQIWNPTSGSLEKNVELPTSEIRSIAIYQGSVSYVLVGTKDSKVILWDIKSDSKVAIFDGHRASVHSVSISSSVPDSQINKNSSNDLQYICIASGGADRTARTWDLTTGKKKKKFRHVRSISTMVVANKGLRPILATGGVERVIKLWDVDSGILLRSLDGHLDQINSISLWEGYQMLLISGSSDHTIRIYDMISGECICLLIGHEDAVLGCTIANYDEPKIVSSSEDLCLIQWNLHAIVKDLYYTGGEDIGTRNSNPAYIPVYHYNAPQELDREELTKDQRKALRKELKKEKRRKNNEKYLNKKTSKSDKNSDDNNNNSGGEEEGDYNDEFFDDLSDPAFSLPTSVTDLHASASLEEKAEMNPSSSSSVPKLSRISSSISIVKGIMKSFGVDNTVGIEPQNTPPSQQQQGPTMVSTETEMRLLANKKAADFSQSEVMSELQKEKLKNQAAAKLKLRLKLKKGIGAKNDLDANIEPYETTKDIDELVALQQLKQDKLSEHKLQEQRRNQSMYMAKNKAADSLQKRLIEIAAKKALNNCNAIDEDDVDSEKSDAD